MEIKYYLLVFFTIVFQYYGFGQIINNKELFIKEMNKYDNVAKIELKFRYLLINKNDSIFEESENIANFFNLDELDTYSIPFFVLDKKNSSSSFLELVNFTSNPNLQEVIVENKNKIVSVFSINNQDITDSLKEFEKINMFMFYYRFDYENEFEIPTIIGGLSLDYFTKERFEKDYFCFRIEGLKGLFFLKDEKIFYATKKISNNKTKDDYDSYESYYRDLKTKILEVDEQFECKIKDEIKNHPIFKKRLKCKYSAPSGSPAPDGY